MRYGYTGKILRINLTARSIGTMDTEKYAAWGGGHGMGSAIFWDLCEDKTMSGFDPRSIVTMMTGPLAGTLSPAAGRCEVQGISPFTYPIEWFNWSSFGGRFAAQLKYAGWDGIVIQGRADRPVWVNIVNDRVTIENAGDLWGKDTRETQEEIWCRVTGRRMDDWHELDSGWSTQRPAVVCIGRAGEKLSRIAALIHDAGNAAGQGGFGGVFGSKNLKAISVIGTGGVPIADPKALFDAWRWHRANFVYNVDSPRMESPKPNSPGFFSVNLSPGGGPVLKMTEPARPHGCQGCPLACNRRTASGIGNESFCMPTMWPMYTLHRVSGPDKEELAPGLSDAEAKRLRQAKLALARHRIADMLQRYGINAHEVCIADGYLLGLFQAGAVGPGKPVPCDLPFERWDTDEFKEALIRMIVEREGIGDDLAEGVSRAAVRWDRYDADNRSGLLANPYWGFFEHYEPRVEVEWSFGSLLASRDTNDHGFNFPFFHIPRIAIEARIQPPLSVEETVRIISEKVLPFAGDPFMFDYGDGPTGIYSEHKAKTVAWSRRYTLFWKNSVGLCDQVWPSFININAPGMRGATPDAEPRFLNAVTGRGLSFEGAMEIGRKICNLDRAILALQGRHRDMEVFTGYVYDQPVTRPFPFPVFENGRWRNADHVGRKIDRVRFEEWKTRYFELEGWDPGTGWPTRRTLEELGLGAVADEMERSGRLGG